MSATLVNNKKDSLEKLSEGRGFDASSDLYLTSSAVHNALGSNV